MSSSTTLNTKTTHVSMLSDPLQGNVPVVSSEQAADFLKDVFEHCRDEMDSD